MNLFQQLSSHINKSPEVISFSRNKVRPEYQDSEIRYREFLLGQQRNISEVAAHMGLTYHGAYSSIKRMIARNQILVVEDKSQERTGWRVTWNPNDLPARSNDEQCEAFFVGKQRSVHDFADHFSLTYEGARGAVRRLLGRGLIIKTRNDYRDSATRHPALFSWATDESGNPVSTETFTQH